MRSVLDELTVRMQEAIRAIGLEGDPLVRVSQDQRYGDYQSNCAMGLAKQAGRKPRELAARLVEHLRVSDLCEPPEIAGPGFINFRLRPDFLASLLGGIPPVSEPAGRRLGLSESDDPETVVVDLSSPNLAKEMHIGHLRSTVIGDCVARVLEFMGHRVYRENHVGDWGTQFGMLVAYLLRVRPETADNPDGLVIKDLESFYVEAKTLFDRDEAFKKEARETVVRLQRGDPATRRIWKAFCEESLRHCHRIYDRLGVTLIDRGESYYTELMDEVVARLEKMREKQDDGFVRISDGALCLFMEGFKTREGDPLPMIVRKADGGYNYATSDLATLVHRVEHLGARRIIYVVGAPQKQHFEMLFAAARRAGWVGDDVQLHHLAFGSVLDRNGRPFKTREGGAVKLKDVLDEAVQRARRVIEQGSKEGRINRSFSAEEADRVAERVGIAAVKYFDLSHALNTDYRFDWDTMLSLEGNTAPYMLYAYARIRSIGRKGGVTFESLPADAPLQLEHPAELALARVLARFAETVQAVARDLKPNLLTEYLSELAKAFSRFYDKKQGVRVLDAPSEEVRTSRLRLCDLTARALKLGLGLLGIETVEQM
ncbi:MAG: arginine--tRNA ligase [Planctomycetota bacterium]|nr:MAG: arginine--tRNA ligase [Planctomycetota bacterium]